MKLYIFRGRARRRMYGATRFETASNLPTDQCSGGWEFYERVELAARGTLRFAVDTGTLRRQVQQNGWYVWDESPPELRREAAAEARPVRREQQSPPAEPETGPTKVHPTPMTTMTPPTTAEVVPPPPVTVATPPEVKATRSVETSPVSSASCNAFMNRSASSDAMGHLSRVGVGRVEHRIGSCEKRSTGRRGRPVRRRGGASIHGPKI